MINKLIRRRGKRGQRGTLLIEFAAALAISGILGTTVVGSLFQLQRTTIDGGAQFELTTEVQRATRWMTRDIHRAGSTDVSDGGAPVSGASFGWTDESGGHSCSYALDSGALDRTCDGESTVVARQLSGLSFSRSGSLVLLSFGVTAAARPDMSEAVSMYVSLGRE